jgi:hypothetical protein
MYVVQAHTAPHSSRQLGGALQKQPETCDPRDAAPHQVLHYFTARQPTAVLHAAFVCENAQKKSQPQTDALQANATQKKKNISTHGPREPLQSARQPNQKKKIEK